LNMGSNQRNNGCPHHPQGSRERSPDHVRKAMSGAKNDPLLARNLASNFNRQRISELLTNPPAGRI
jgi:hypothetical protein